VESSGFEYNIGDPVYLRTDPDQHMRIITAIVLREGGTMYEVSYGMMANSHSACELSETKNVINY
jgi:hypothetical protein